VCDAINAFRVETVTPGTAAAKMTAIGHSERPSLRIIRRDGSRSVPRLPLYAVSVRIAFVPTCHRLVATPWPQFGHSYS
jgi:hypothetical protein